MLAAHTCNPSYLGDWDQEDHGSRPAQTNSSGDPVSKIARPKWTWRCGSSGRAPVLQVWSPESKFQLYQKKKKNSLYVWICSHTYFWGAQKYDLYPQPVFLLLLLLINFFFLVLWFELQASCLLGRYSTTLAAPLTIFALLIFQIGYLVYAWSGLDYNPPVYTSPITGMMGMHHHS
jgi:hypothetical protein